MHVRPPGSQRWGLAAPILPTHLQVLLLRVVQLHSAVGQQATKLQAS